jgi:hypothetical protein
MATRKREMWAEAGVEPRLDDMIADPLVRVIMRHDGVSSEELRGMLEALRAQRREVSAQAKAAGETMD